MGLWGFEHVAVTSNFGGRDSPLIFFCIGACSWLFVLKRCFCCVVGSDIFWILKALRFRLGKTDGHLRIELLGRMGLQP